MSREIMGLLDEFSRVSRSENHPYGRALATSGDDGDPVIEVSSGLEASDGPQGDCAPLRPSRRRPKALALLALFTLGVTLGVSNAGSWSVSPDHQSPVTAVVTQVGLRAPPADGRPGQGTVTLSLRNDRDVPVSVYPPTTADQWGFAVRITSTEALGVGAHGEHVMTVDVALFCDRALSFGLAPLRITDADSAQRQVPLLGAQAEVTKLCGLLDQPPLMSARAAPDGHRLQLFLQVPTGRSERIVLISAAGVPLTAGPLPLIIAGPSTSVWLSPPAECAPSWRADHIPTTLDISVRGSRSEVPALISVMVGSPLADWLLAGPCV